METLCGRTNALLVDVQTRLQRLERAPIGPGAGAGDPTGENGLEAEIDAVFGEIAANCDRLDVMVNKEPPSRRTAAKIRVDQLKHDSQHLRAALRNVQHRRFQKEEEARERDILLSKDFAPNEPDTSIMIESALQHGQRLNSAGRNLDEMLFTGSSILSSLRDQRGMLKGVQRKVLDIINTLGLSNTVLRLIERRSGQDKVILFGGMILTCIVMFLVWNYLV